MPLSCKHEDISEGPRLPLQYGSAPTLVCKDCGMWRDARDALPRYRPAAAFRPAAELLKAIARRDDE